MHGSMGDSKDSLQVKTDKITQLQTRNAMLERDLQTMRAGKEKAEQQLQEVNWPGHDIA
jgi:hypothetical protein